MTPREFRQEKEFDHFTELTSTGIKPNYVNIELFAHEYHQAKLKLLGIGVVVRQSEQLCQYDKMCVRKRIHIKCPSDCKDDTRLLA